MAERKDGYRNSGEETRPSLKKIKEVVAEMNKIGFELPEGLKRQDEMRELHNLASMNTYDLDDIVFYSEKYGILEFQHAQNINNGIGGALRWTDKNNNFLLEIISYDNHYSVYYIGKYREPEKEEK